MNQPIHLATRLQGLRVLIALLLGLLLVLGIQAQPFPDRTAADVQRSASDAWPVRCDRMK